MQVLVICYGILSFARENEMTKPIAPFLNRVEPPLVFSEPASARLQGLSFVAKDNFDIEGMVTGCGNPEWADDAEPAMAHAAIVRTLLDNGAALVGKTHMDELAYSLMGVNARYGTPENPAAPSRVPGGSSSGSASAVAARLADIGLGTDTGGSVRLPAAFCGLFGWRPTHGLMPTEGLVPLAPSYDVPGFMTRDIDTLAILAQIFAGDQTDGSEIRLVYPSDVWRLCDEETAATLKAALPKGDRDDSPLLSGRPLSALLQTFRIHQGYEAWQQFGAWIERREPKFGPGIRERFAVASRISESEFADARADRERFRAHLTEVLTPGTVMVYPTAPGPAPLLAAEETELDAFRNRALTLLSIAGHGGLPQISLPLAASRGSPLGLSLVAAPGSDRLLIEAARRVL